MKFSDYPVATDCLGLVSDWTYALNGNGELSDVLDRLMRLLKAEVVAIVRMSKADFSTHSVARSDMQKGKIWPTQFRSYADEIVGEFISTAKVGSIWKLSEAKASDFEQLADKGIGVAGNIFEGIISPLETTRTYIDFIELHFDHQPAEHDLNLLVMLIGTLTREWSRRAPASVSKAINQKRKLSRVLERKENHFSVLDPENPAQLSRSEYRICSLLSEGMTVHVIAKVLSISPATVRSHLSSTFSKTGATNQVELLYQLNNKPKLSQETDVIEKSNHRIN
ncbi:LuxR C-terminal-related transcriptional regulator [Sulfitobacter sp. S223]|uniref:helix-turn-helix transcriptional regulator n=1 Tax=Sulfitobacter sp. S223 TaxID=2867023 RepID=UPI0021A882E1|nr:LuxR family transcriptional regulator [Sulfitobacter sp. S223]UWR27531.1 LuxR C-terminal-related transcriptional regulator [Sulfitobacter sp. S223]